VRSLFWSRIDVPGCDHALVNDAGGLHARGVALAIDPVPYTCRYELVTDPAWVTTRLAVTVEGAGWLREVRLEHGAAGWRVTTSEQGSLGSGLPGIEDPDRLADAIDVDLGGAPLPNTLPVRRLRLLEAPPGTEHRLTMAWVRVPSLEVFPSAQTYTVVGPGQVRFDDGSFSAVLELDEDGYVTHYPGLAKRSA
jgi:uncharacterized protein